MSGYALNASAKHARGPFHQNVFSAETTRLPQPRGGSVDQPYLRFPHRAAPVELHDAHALLPRLAGRMPDSTAHEPDLGIDVEVAVVVRQLQSRGTYERRKKRAACIQDLFSISHEMLLL